MAVRVFDPTTGYIVKASRLFAASVEQRRLIDPSQVEVRTPYGIFMHPSAILLTPFEIDTHAAAIDALFEVASSRRIAMPELVRIEAGTFPVEGSNLFGKGKPSVKDITMSGFYAGKYPVTVGEYREFVETGYKIVGDKADDLIELLADRKKYRHPVIFVNLQDKEAYVKWLRETTSRNWFILSAAQQEFIRRGSSGRTYPWGDNWRKVPYYNTKRTALVDAWPKGVTPEGVSGLGIVWEATRSCYGDYDPRVVNDPEGPASGNMEVRGGSAWYCCQGDFNGAHRDNFDPGLRSGIIGFRIGRT